MRSLGAIAREAERQSKRRQRELERLQREQNKQLALDLAELEVQQYENLIDRLKSVHKDGSARADWQAMADSDPPTEPTRQSVNETLATEERYRYKPSVADKLLGRTTKKRAELDARIDEAKAEDDRKHSEALKRHEEALADWATDVAFAKRVLAGDAEARLEALSEAAPWSELAEFGAEVEIFAQAPQSIECMVRVASESAIPSESKSLLKSGKVSTKQMPKGRFYELHQDYVCSCVFRVARECLAILPVDTAVVTATSVILDTSTGHLAEQPILTVAIPRATLESLNLDWIDPSDALKNFVHRMKFKKTKGFEPVERLDATAIATR